MQDTGNPNHIPLILLAHTIRPLKSMALQVFQELKALLRAQTFQ